MRLTGDVINCAVKVHKYLGSGFLESVYESNRIDNRIDLEFWNDKTPDKEKGKKL